MDELAAAYGIVLRCSVFSLYGSCCTCESRSEMVPGAVCANMLCVCVCVCVCVCACVCFALCGFRRGCENALETPASSGLFS